MDNNLLHQLMGCETDIDGVMSRFGGDEALYLTCLAGFLQDPTMAELEHAMQTESWDEAFTAVHALKGLAGNMGFVPLFHAAAHMVMLIRAGRTREVSAAYLELKQCYGKICAVIRENCGVEPAESKGEGK